MDEANELVLQHLRTLRVPEELAQQLREALKRAKYESLPEEVACSSSLVRLLAQAQAERSETQSLGGLTADDCSGEGGGVGAVPNGGFSTVAIPWPEGPLVQADPVTRTGGSWPQEVCSFGWPVAVTLHVYDLGPSGGCRALNAVLRFLSMGVFHCGVEVYGREWSYRKCVAGTGVFSCRPRSCPGQSYSESIVMGQMALPKCDVLRLINSLSKKWSGADYNTLKRNCCHFCKDLCQLLNVGAVPERVLAAAATGEYLELRERTLRASVLRSLRSEVCCSASDLDCEVEEVAEAMPRLAPPSNTAYPSQTLPSKLEADLMNEYFLTTQTVKL